ncbi:hypothetical protein ACQY1H_13880 [Agrobacterium vitis]|uniref:hypothetical protein n=1 Tax=Agrobacterium vitis TaxID=373 RepID=UPI003D288B38
MTTPQTFDQTLFKICKIHAAWLPITNGFELGDYGIIDSGIFRKLGNVTRDFGLTFITKPGASSNVKFSSNGVAVTHVSGEAEAKLAGNADVTATLSISFEKTDSFYISGSLSSLEIQDIAALSKKLRRTLDWQTKHYVISSTYIGQTCTIISSLDAGASITLSGNASDLTLLEAGKAAGGIDVTSKRHIGIEIIGERGIIGINMFRLKFWSDTPKLLSETEKEDLDFTSQQDELRSD